MTAFGFVSFSLLMFLLMWNVYSYYCTSQRWICSCHCLNNCSYERSYISLYFPFCEIALASELLFYLINSNLFKLFQAGFVPWTSFLFRFFSLKYSSPFKRKCCVGHCKPKYIQYMHLLDVTSIIGLWQAL